jgi:transcriptional regulator with XRE-family HTH domain
MTELHEVLAHMIIRKPAAIMGAELRFLRRRLGLTGKEFAARVGITPVRLSQLENSKTAFPKRADLLFRLTFAALIAQRDSKPFPSDLGPLVDQFTRAWNIGTHRVQHNPNAPPERIWQEAA